MAPYRNHNYLDISTTDLAHIKIAEFIEEHKQDNDVIIKLFT